MVGQLGRGYHEATSRTVTTYDSAYIYAECYGDRFALVHEGVHHDPKCFSLPAPSPRLPSSNESYVLSKLFYFQAVTCSKAASTWFIGSITIKLVPSPGMLLPLSLRCGARHPPEDRQSRSSFPYRYRGRAGLGRGERSALCTSHRNLYRCPRQRCRLYYSHLGVHRKL